MSVTEKIIAKCELAYPLYKGDCVDFAADVLKHFFSSPDFDGHVLADTVVANLRTSSSWTQTRSIAKAIAAAKSGHFVLAGVRAKDLNSANGHLAIVVGLDGEESSGTEPPKKAIVPIGYAGSIGGAPIKRERLSGTFNAAMVRGEKIDYFMRVPDQEPAASGLMLLVQANTVFTAPGMPTKAEIPSMAFGKRVSADFRSKVHKIALSLGIDPNHLMAAMAFETGETFSPSIPNKQSGATGLIQFMPKTAAGLGTTTDALAKMTAEAQLDYVDKYFLPHKNKLKNLGDVYMAILWPRAISKADDWPLFNRDGATEIEKKRYAQNSGLDLNKDGLVTRHEAAWKVEKMLVKGLKPENSG